GVEAAEIVGDADERAAIGVGDVEVAGALERGELRALPGGGLLDVDARQDGAVAGEVVGQLERRLAGGQERQDLAAAQVPVTVAAAEIGDRLRRGAEAL